MTLDLGSILDQLRTYFSRHDTRWAIAGGLALGAYGAARSTFDVDVIVPRDHQDQLISFLESEAFETLHKSRGFSNHLHRERGRIDVIYVGRVTAAKLFETVSERLVQGRSLPVPSAEHLIAMKLLAYRNDPSRRLQDLADIRALVEASSLDRNVVRSLFESYDLGKDADNV